jgi:hypothetical protein
MNSLNPALDWIDFIAYDGQTEAVEKIKNMHVSYLHIFMLFSNTNKKNNSERISPHCIVVGSLVYNRERLILQTIYLRNKKIWA